MAKVFDYAVIYNGVYYPANTPIEEEKKAVKEDADKRTGTKPKTRNNAD